MHKRYSNIKGPLKPDPDFKCKKCRGEVSNATIQDIEPVVINGEEIKKVSSFCYLGDFIGQRGECFNATTARIRSAWKKFRDLLPVLTCCGLSLKSHGYACNACVHSVLLYSSETWAATQEDFSCLNRSDMMMIRWICSAKLRDKVPSEELRSRLGLGSIENALRRGRLRWYGHVQCMDPDTWPRKLDKTIITGNNPRGHPRKAWLQCIKKDLAVKGLDASLVQNRNAWHRAIHPKSQSGCENVVGATLGHGNNAR